MKAGALIWLLFIASSATAQHATAPRYRLTTVPTQLLFMELPITLERSLGRHTLGITGAYRPDLVQSGEIPGRGPYHMQNYWNFAYRSTTAGLMHKYYLRDRLGLHLETSLLYRVWWFDEKETRYNGGGEPFSGLRSERQEVFILKLLLGKSIIWHRKKGPAHVLEFFAGPSIRFKQTEFTTHVGLLNAVKVEELGQQEEFWLPALQIGLRYGIGWGRQTTRIAHHILRDLKLPE